MAQCGCTGLGPAAAAGGGWQGAAAAAAGGRNACGRARAEGGAHVNTKAQKVQRALPTGMEPNISAAPQMIKTSGSIMVNEAVHLPRLGRLGLGLGNRLRQHDSRAEAR